MPSGRTPCSDGVSDASRRKPVAEPDNSGKEETTAGLLRESEEAPSNRFHQLHDKVWRDDILKYAYQRCKANKGAAGVDGQSFDQIEEYGRERWLGELAEELRRKGYRPAAIRRVWIGKANGGRAATGHRHDTGPGGPDGGGAGDRTDLRRRIWNPSSTDIDRSEALRMRYGPCIVGCNRDIAEVIDADTAAATSTRYRMPH